MRRLHRPLLDAGPADFLADREARVHESMAAGTLDIDAQWAAARRAVGLRPVLQTLQQMTGDHQRCMYCLDSHGTDIEHFWPKAPYPGRAFQWPNLLLCCTECGRFKGQKFPQDGQGPLLIDPTADDPWDYLDFDPLTGNITARFNLAMAQFERRGEATVRVLHMDAREALSSGHQKTWRRLNQRLGQYLADQSLDLCSMLIEADDHGLLGWCTRGNGMNQAPFDELRRLHTEKWDELVARVQG